MCALTQSRTRTLPNKKKGEKKMSKMYRNFDTGELWSEEEIKDIFEHEDELYEKYSSFEEYMDYLLDLGRSRTGGIIEAEEDE